MSQKFRKITDKEYRFLDELGLSSDELELLDYMLSVDKDVNAKQAADFLATYPNAIYRIFYELESLSLIKRTVGRPRAYKANDISVGFPAAADIKENSLKSALELITTEGVSSTSARIIIGRRRGYDEYIKEADTCKKSIRIFAIGIAMNEALLSCHRSALKRGVRINHVVQRFKPSNYNVIHKWKEIGIDIRLSKGEQGFHIVIFDECRVLITFSDTNNTDDRIGILTDNPTAVEMFNLKFKEIWDGSEAINI